MKQPTSRILYNYWNEIRRHRMAPTRFEVEPAQIAPILSETFILERTPSATYPFRLAGTRICERFGQELRGLDFAGLAGDDQHVLRKALAAVTADGVVAVVELEAETNDGRTATFEAIVMPLMHPADEVTRYLGAISAIEAPAWLGTEKLSPTVLLAHEIIWPEGRPSGHLDADERQLPFAPELAAARVVRSNRRQFRVLDGGRKP